MKRFPYLWQSIFIYSFVLITVSIGIGGVVHRSNTMEQLAEVALEFSREPRSALEGKSLQEAAVLLKMFSINNIRLWLEDGEGVLLAGERVAGVADAEKEFDMEPDQNEKVVLWAGPTQKQYLVVSPLMLRDRAVTLYTVYTPPKGLHSGLTMFAEIVCIGGVASLLAFWMAYVVCRPLRLLQREVAGLTGDLSQRATVRGNGEIADVARGVNKLVDGLCRHITGMRQLASNVSHELRSPLARMALSVEMIGEGLDALQKTPGHDAAYDAAAYIPSRMDKIELAKKHHHMLRDELAYMDKLIGKTLLFSAIEVRDPDSLIQDIAYSDLCENACFRYEHMFEQAGLTFLYEIEPDLHVVGDNTLLMQLLSNLLDNAVKYASVPEEPVCLALAHDNGFAALTVENACEPFSREAMEHLFEPFFRHEQHTGTGVGLGLSLVRRIAQLHKGQATAQYAGQKLLICVRLPLKAKSQKTARESAPEYT